MNYVPLLFLIVATYTDVSEKKIKNTITYPLILLGLLVNIYQFGLSGFLSSLVGILIAFFVVSMLPGFRHGGGDLKLAMGIGSYIGLSHILYFLFFWFALSLLVCNIKLLKEKGFKHFKTTVLKELLTMGKTDTEGLERTIGAPLMLMGYLITLAYKGV